MLKWELYRIKCDQIDEDYAAFKKTQLKINWWLRIILERRMVKKTLENFVEHRERTFLKQRRMMKSLQIINCMRNFIKRKGADLFERNSLFIRNKLILGTLP